ncbi:45169_t:CDS:2 [Gigaspora margarita]|uniref:45169_t:CDS:1 n=1 Tax=Gigaspora margarita TaxID=4874 RepID=A0ABN7UE76_GIGMA|nr:45169_t:CDS:2 [Gigaspora margarita]
MAVQHEEGPLTKQRFYPTSKQPVGISSCPHEEKKWEVTLCVDIRELNKRAKSDFGRLRCIQGAVKKWHSAKQFGPYQIRACGDAIQFNKCTAIFQRLMDQMLQKEIWKFVLAYIDDVSIYFPDFEKFLERETLGACQCDADSIM